MFFTGAGAGFRQNSEHRGQVQYFFNTGAGTGAGFVEKYRGLTGAEAGAGAPVGS